MVTGQFIELDRRFRDVTERDDTEEITFRNYAAPLLGIELGLGWDKVLASRIVVVLGEPGSGKTWELRNRAKRIREQKFDAFYVPLDRLVNGSLPEAIAPDEGPVFSEWRRSSRPATFFLDSVDEAKFHKQQDFERAMDNFIRGVSFAAVDRIRVIISGRISEWRGHADRDVLLRRLSSTTRPLKTSETEDSNKVPELRIVQLIPLDRQRVRKFAEGAGLQDPEAFIEALDIHHAWEFTGRPIDVAELINYWQEHRRLGTLTELIEFDLDKKLRETSERIQSDPLTSQKARIGAECLGAAVLFCRRFSFFVPDIVPPDDTSGAMNAVQCLPSDWTQLMCKAILNRAVFDVASYGRIRFHHRRIAEYLAARWLERRMKEGCPYPVLEDLLFAHHDGRWIIRPSLRPVTAWLALDNETWSQRIRDRILASAPDLFLVHGDPESLPLNYTQLLLESLITRYAGREHVYKDVDAEALSRLADSQLAAFISAKILDRMISSYVRILLLQLIRHGRLVDCLGAVLKIVASPDEAEELKSYAVAAIRDLGDQQIRIRLAQITQDFDSLGTDLCARLCEALYPLAIDSAGLVNLLRKAQEVRRYSVGLPWYLKRHLETELQEEQATDLLHELLSLAEETPRVLENGQETPISERFYWLGEVIPTVLLFILKRPLLNELEIKLSAQTLWLLGHFKHYGVLDQDLPKELNTLLDRHPDVRRAYVWLSVDERRKKTDREPHLFSLFGYYEVLEQRDADIDWLIRDVREGTSREIRTTALLLAIDLWYSIGCRRSIRKRIRNAVKGDRELHRVFKERVHNLFYLWFIRFLHRHRVYPWKDKAWVLKHKLRDRWSKLRVQIWLWRNLKNLRKGVATHALIQLAREASEDHHHWGAHSWEPLISKKGKLVARAAADGWKAAWRGFEPLLPHEKPLPNQTDGRIIAGLSGINVSIAEGFLDLTTLTPAEARLACRYAVNELNGFPDWLPELAHHHPEAVREVLAECIRGEWKFSADREQVHEVLSDLRYYGEGLTHLVEDVILEELNSSDPLNHKILEAALTVLLKLPEPPRQALTEIAARRVSSYSIDDPSLTLWIVAWLQLDAAPAIRYLKETLAQAADPDSLMVRVCAGLSSRRSSDHPLIIKPDYLKPTYLRELVPLVYRHVRVEDDIDRTGGNAYSPTTRDDAQDFRNGLFERLAQVSGRETDDVLHAFIDDPLFYRYRDWILHLIDRRTEIAADAPPWNPADIPAFMREHEMDPHSDHDLFKIACKRFITIKDEVERGDISARYDLNPDDQESRLRSWLARQLRARSSGRYTVPQEEEIDLEQKPDLRIEAPNINPVSIEVKWADHCSLRKLKEGLAEQLVGQYLRAPSSNYGIYVLGYKNIRNYWRDSEAGRRLSFDNLIQYLQNIAKEILSQNDEINGLKVFGINFSRPPS